MLDIHELNQFYGESHTLWDLSLKIDEGARVCLLGRNGVGKTTLLKAIMGLLPVKGGNILFSGQNIVRRPAPIRAKLGIGYVPQGREIFSKLTVLENLQIGLAAGYDKTCTVPPRIFDMFPALKFMSQRRGGDLSGGLQQQLAIGRSLAINPKLLILDEPTEGIQPNIVHEIGDLLLQLNREENMTILLAETKVHFARKMADYFYIMDKGRCVADGPMGDLTDELISRHLTV